MRYFTVPEPVTPRTIDGKIFRENTTDDDGKVITKEIGEVNTHRWLMIYVVNDVSLKKNEQGQVTSQTLKISRTLHNGTWGEGSGYKGNKRTGKLDELFASAKPGSIIPLEEEDWEVVKKIIEEKEWASASFGKCFLPFEQAWMDAKEKSPELAAAPKASEPVQAQA